MSPSGKREPELSACLRKLASDDLDTRGDVIATVSQRVDANGRPFVHAGFKALLM